MAGALWGGARVLPRGGRGAGLHPLAQGGAPMGSTQLALRRMRDMARPASSARRARSTSNFVSSPVALPPWAFRALRSRVRRPVPPITCGRALRYVLSAGRARRGGGDTAPHGGEGPPPTSGEDGGQGTGGSADLIGLQGGEDDAGRAVAVTAPCQVGVDVACWNIRWLRSLHIDRLSAKRARA